MLGSENEYMAIIFVYLQHRGPYLKQTDFKIIQSPFAGDSVDDCGGGYSESIAEMCDELQNGSVSLLI